MSDTRGQGFVRYLSSKKSADDRALNNHVRDMLAAALPKSSPKTPLKVLELGAGIGTMIERLIDWKLLAFADYTAVDSDADCSSEFRRRMARLAGFEGFEFSRRPGNTALIRTQEGEVSLRFEQADVYDFLSPETSGAQQWDLGIAHAFMDVADIEAVLSRFCNLIRPGGLLYLTLNYDGETIFLPKLNRAFEKRIMQLYNRSMDERTAGGRKTGGSHTGRKLLGYFKALDAAILAAGASDWIVLPGPQGYPRDESYFLHYILDTIYNELKGRPGLDQNEFEAWVQMRHDQAAKAELIFIAKNMDLLVRVSD